MKLNKLILVSLFLLAILCLGAVSAQENMTSETDGGQNQDVLIPVQEVSEETTNEIQITSNDDDEILTASDEEIVGEITADNVTVDASNVFEGQNATISVTVPEATGTVNITVGDDTYTPEFISGVATQTISKYSIGLNNVTIQYNDIIKQTSFKVLDGVVTEETFYDYFEEAGRHPLKDYVPEGATLDFRDNITLTIQINKPINLFSSTGASLANIQMLTGCDGINISNIRAKQFNIQSYCTIVNSFANTIYISANCSLINTTANAYNIYIPFANLNVLNINGTKITVNAECNISDVTVDTITVNANCNISNVIANGITYGVTNQILADSVVGSLTMKSDSTILNCTIKNGFAITASGIENINIINTTFESAVQLESQNGKRYNVVNSTIKGYLRMSFIIGVLFENNTIHDYIQLRSTNNASIKNNYINAPASDYAITIFSNCINTTVVNNKVYSKDYCGINAISYTATGSDTIENNTPTQIDLGIDITLNNIFYDDNTTVTVNMSGVEGNITFYLNNQPISVVELTNGIATQIIDGKYNIGSNDVSAVYEDKINDLYAVNHISLTVNKVPFCPVDLVYGIATEGKTTTVDVVLPGDANGTILFTITNGDYAITINQLANGSQNIIKIPALFEGNYSISAVFSNSIKYVTNSSSGIISFVHVPVYKLSAKAISMDYYDGTKYKVLVTKDGEAVGAGEIVKITFNGKTTSVKTDKNGYATLALNAAPKTYTIKAAYQGKTISTKVVIKNVLKANNLAKKKATTIKYTATLKNSKGKAIAGKVVKFKIKGKTYSAKTNSKGVATVSLKNLAVGKYYIVSSYGACTVKKLITIKK